MKHLFLLFAILSAIFASNIEIDDETHGCIIEEGEDTCCWMNRNGCCKPRPGASCSQAITECCKTRVFDEETKTYKYTYRHSLAHGFKKKEKEDERRRRRERNKKKSKK